MYGNALLVVVSAAPPSSLHTIALFGHVVGVAFGVGGATATDMVFVRCLRMRRIDQTLATVLELASKLVTAGLVLLSVSGIVLIRTGTHTSERFWAKMVVVIVVAANGACAHWFTFPRMSQAMREGQVRLTVPFLNSLSVAAAVSGVSWYSATILGTWKTANLHLFQFLGIYVALLALAVIGSLLVTPLVLRANVFEPIVLSSNDVVAVPPVSEEVTTVEPSETMATNKRPRLINVARVENHRALSQILLDASPAEKPTTLAPPVNPGRMVNTR